MPWLDGYEGARPVRVGNAAADQLQLDVYGEVADALAQAAQWIAAAPPRTGALVHDAGAVPRRAWHRPDEGIWEVRGGPGTSPIPR